MPSFGGAGLNPPRGRGALYGSAYAPSEASSTSTSFASQRSSTCPGLFDQGAVPAIGRGGIGIGRGQMVLQNAGIVTDLQFCCSLVRLTNQVVDFWCTD